MKTIYSAIAIDQNKNPLSLDEQFALALIKASKKGKIKKASIIGWPFLAYKISDQGYVFIDQTGKMSLNFSYSIIEDYSKIVEKISESTNEDEFLENLSRFSWNTIKGHSDINIQGISTIDISNNIIASQDMDIQILPVSIDDYSSQMKIDDLNKLINNIKLDISNIDSSILKLNSISEKFIENLTKIKNETRQKYEVIIASEQQNLTGLLNTQRKAVYEEVKSKASEYSQKITELEALAAQGQIDFEAGRISNQEYEHLKSSKAETIKIMESEISKVTEKYAEPIRVQTRKIKDIEEQENSEISKIDSKISIIKDATNNVISKLNELKQTKLNELQKVNGIIKNVQFSDDKVQIILPFFIALDEYNDKVIISQQLYKGRNESLFKILSNVNNISQDLLNVDEFYKILINEDFEDNIKKLSNVINSGLEKISNDGWRIKKNLNEYYME